MEEAEPPEGKCRPEAILLAKVRASPSSTVMKGEGAVPSQGDVIEAKTVDASGRAAEVILEALELEPAQEAGMFTRVVWSGIDGPELGNYAVQVLEVYHIDPFHLSSSTCDCDGGSDLMLQEKQVSDAVGAAVSLDSHWHVV